VKYYTIMVKVREEWLEHSQFVDKDTAIYFARALKTRFTEVKILETK
jgi:hypothetical protein